MRASQGTHCYQDSDHSNHKGQPLHRDTWGGGAQVMGTGLSFQTNSYTIYCISIKVYISYNKHANKQYITAD